MIKRIVTFSIGGPMRGHYAELEAENEIIIRNFCITHWPKDWVTTYDLRYKFYGFIKKFNLRRLCIGWIELYDGRLFFHENVPVKIGNNGEYQVGLDSPEYEKNIIGE